MTRLIFILMLIFQSVYAQVPNYSFENWSSINPDAWQTTNIPILPLSVLPDSDAYEGLLSVKGMVVANNYNEPYAPYLGIAGGAATGFNVSQGFEFLVGWMKLFLNPGDRFSADVRMYDENLEAVGQGLFYETVSIVTWTSFIIPVTYWGDSTKTCGMFFTITDSTGNVAGQPGSYFLIDNLTLDGQVDIVENNVEDDFSLYPNPARTFVKVKSNSIHNNFYSIADVTGSVVASGKVDDSSRISIQELSSGVYFFSVKEGERRVVRKLVIE